jgi:magnesium-transporting ATPase (P-type)
MEKGNESKLKATAEALKKLDLKEFQYHKKTVEEVVADLKTNLKTGLTQKQAEELLKVHGHNQLEKEEEESLWEKIKESFEDLLVRILLLAAVISFVIALTGKYLC